MLASNIASEKKKGRRARFQERTADEEAEAQKKARYDENLKAKSGLIMAEFEKHKKKMFLTASETLQENETKLCAQVNHLTSENKKKEELLAQLKRTQEKEAQETADNDVYRRQMKELDSMEPKEIAHFALEQAPERIPPYMPFRDEDPAYMGERLLQLKEAWENIERMYVLEGEAEAAVKEKLSEVSKDHYLLEKKVNMLRISSEHFDRRFTHLKEIEFKAKTRQGETMYQLNEIRDLTSSLARRESVYKKDKYKEMETEEATMQDKQGKHSNVLVEIDEGRMSLVLLTMELTRLSREQAELVERKKNCKTVSRYAHLMENLHNMFFDTVNKDKAVEVIRALAERENPFLYTEESRMDSSRMDGSRLLRNNSSGVSRDSVMSAQKPEDRNFYLGQISKFYDKFPSGPDDLGTKLIQVYAEQSFQETSMNKLYQEMQNDRLRKENLLFQLQKELEQFRLSPDNPADRRPSEPKETEGLGIVVMNSEAMTVNQAKHAFEIQRNRENDLNLVKNYEKFLMRCYLDLIEMAARLGKVISAAAEYADIAMPDNLRKIGKEMVQQITLFKKPKKIPSEILTPKATEANNFTRSITGNSVASERDAEKGEDFLEVFQAFLSKFGDFPLKAAEFTERLREDQFIATFIKMDDIQLLLDQCDINGDIQLEMEKLIKEIPDLRDHAVENMIKRLQMAFGYYNEAIYLLKYYRDESVGILQQNKIPIPASHLTKSSVEPSEIVKIAIRKRQESNIMKYDSDVAAGSRTDKKLDTGPDQIVQDDENLDTEDFHTRLDEVTKLTLNKSGVRSYGDGTAFLSKTKKYEEKRRIMIKQKKEQMKIAFMNMNEDQYMDWKRSKMKSGDGLLPFHQREELKGLRRSVGTSVNQYRKLTEPTTHLVELKKMIESSKMLSKINILERTKSTGAGLISLKFDILGQYIPNDPIKIPRAAVTHRIRPLNTPTKGDLLSGSNRYSLKTPQGTMTSRNSPVEDEVPKEKMFRSRSQVTMAPLTTSRFHQTARISYKKADLNLEDETPRSSIDGLRESLVATGKSSHFKSKSQKLELRDDYLINSQRNTQIRFNPNPGKGMFVKSPDSQRFNSKATSKASTALPKLEKKVQKSNKKSRPKRKSMDHDISSPNEDLSRQLNMQGGDPALNNVFSPDFFTPTVFPVTMFQHIISEKPESQYTKSNILVPLYSSNSEAVAQQEPEQPEQPEQPDN